MAVTRDRESSDEAQRANRPRKRSDLGVTPDSRAGFQPAVGLLLGLQRTAGNAATTELVTTLQRHPAGEGDAPIPAEVLKP